MPTDFDTFRKLQEQDKIRVQKFGTQAKFEEKIREKVMFIESYVLFYSQPGYPRAEAERLKHLMNNTYKELIRMLKDQCSEEQYFLLVNDDRDTTLKALVEHYRHSPLPQRRDSPAYQSLHPRTKRAWSIRTSDSHTKF